MKKLTVGIIIFILMFSCTIISSASETDDYNLHDYVIKRYYVDINVNENNTFDITETITAHFNVAKHGIIRTIPLRNKVTRLDGTTSVNIAQISNVKVDNEYKTSRNNEKYKIQIGSANYTLTGDQTYALSYTYNLGKDTVKNYDEFYFNIIGSEWDTIIDNITFRISMPKEFDSNKIEFSSGVSGSVGSSRIMYFVEGNDIYGSYDGILDSGEALTIRCELPEGYFKDTGLEKDIVVYIMYLVPILFLIISILLWSKFGHTENIEETVEYYPPNGLNSLDVGFLYKGYANKKDILSLIFYLASKGYIKIINHDIRNLKIVKLNEYDGENKDEQTFLDGLFGKNKTEVTLKELKDSLNTVANQILSDKNSKNNKNKIFEKSAAYKRKYIFAMILAAYCVITIIPIYSNLEVLNINIIITLLLLGAVLIAIGYIYIKREYLSFNIEICMSIIMLLIFGIGQWADMVFPILWADKKYLLGFVFGIVCIWGMLICYKHITIRTPYGNEMFARLKCFKRFLQNTEKEKIEDMVVENPNYFYNALPYMYVLGISDKRIKRFESMAGQPPTWYESSDDISMGRFIIRVNSILTDSSYSGSVYGLDYSDSFMDSSGGNISDGGSGGGGGSSW